ncbi:MAG: hypothetical protein JO264_08415 [Acidisphaera sp.]|nr:hypothetical protein [Acidisphaera sp.]
MNDVELAALSALVASDTAEYQGCLVQFGERPWYHRTPHYLALRRELDRRGILPPDSITPAAITPDPIMPAQPEAAGDTAGEAPPEPRRRHK